jgi:nucleoside-diphosphate-sugar epimerase
VDVEDVADAVAACVEQGAAGVFNIASGRAVTNVDLARRCVELFDSSSEVIVGGRPDPDDDVRWEVSIARAEEQLGYSPSRSLEDSLRTVASAMSKSPRRDELRK